MQNEPIIIINSIVAAVEAGLILGMAFGLDLSADQTASVIGAVVAVGAVVSTIMGRGRVFAPSTVEEVAANVAAGRDAGLYDV